VRGRGQDNRQSRSVFTTSGGLARFARRLLLADVIEPVGPLPDLKLPLIKVNVLPPKPRNSMPASQ
jgi:hypothetical protein